MGRRQFCSGVNGLNHNQKIVECLNYVCSFTTSVIHVKATISGIDPRFLLPWGATKGMGHLIGEVNKF